jgi:hypothetical protein
MRFLSGHVLYYLSGFLSLQLDIQNFLARLGYGGSVVDTNIFTSANMTSLSPSEATKDVAEDLIFSRSSAELYSKLTQDDRQVSKHIR